MRWAEIDMDAHVWTIPRERTKNDIAHNVPLCSQSLAILHALPVIPSDTGLVFTTTGYSSVGGFSRAKTRIDGAIARARPSSEPLLRWTFHDLRRTVASGMARLRIDMHVVEKVSSGSFAGIVSVYQRHTFAEEKREAARKARAPRLTVYAGAAKKARRRAAWSALTRTAKIFFTRFSLTKPGSTPVDPSWEFLITPDGAHAVSRSNSPRGALRKCCCALLKDSEPQQRRSYEGTHRGNDEDRSPPTRLI